MPKLSDVPMSKIWGVGCCLFWIVLMSAVTVTAFAAPVSIEFKSATVPEVAQVLLKEILKKDFVLSPEVAASDKRVTISVRQVEPENLMPLIEGVLKTVEAQIENRGGVLYVERTKPQSFVSQVMPTQPLPAPQSQQMQTGVGQGMPPGLMTPYGAQQPVKVPDEIESYQPRGRSVEFLAAVAKAAGALVVDFKGTADKLVFSGTKEAMEKARKIIAEVDSPPASVQVRAILVEFTDGSTSTRSLNIALNLLSDKLGIAYAAGSALSNALTWKTGNLNAVLSAIDGDSRFKYVAEPTIKVVDGQQAKFMVGSEQPTRGAVTVDNNGNSQQSIDYKSAGVQINLKPRILADHVQIEISQQLSSFSLTTTSNIDSPTILKREASTTVSVRPGELVVLAGMDEQKDSSSTTGLFFLPDWMRGRNSEGSRSQLVLLLEVVPESSL